MSSKPKTRSFTQNPWAFIIWRNPFSEPEATLSCGRPVGPALKKKRGDRIEVVCFRRPSSRFRGYITRGRKSTPGTERSVASIGTPEGPGEPRHEVGARRQGRPIAADERREQPLLPCSPIHIYTLTQIQHCLLGT